MNEFKIGDWVTAINKKDFLPHQSTLFKIVSIDNFNNCFGENENEYANAIYLKKWEPQVGEWIVIHNIHPTMNNPTSFTVRQYFADDPYWKLHIEKCEPFIGKLPSFLKDNK